MSFQNCGLVYLLVQKNHEAKDNVQGVYQCVDDTTCLRPVWVFMTGASGSAFNTSTDDIHGASVIVDALDGTLYYYEETGGYCSYDKVRDLKEHKKQIFFDCSCTSLYYVYAWGQWTGIRR